MRAVNQSTLYRLGQASAGDRLRFVLKSRGVSVSHFAETVGVSRQAVYGWIKRGKISAEYLEPVSRALSVSTHWLMFGDVFGGNGPEDEACHRRCDLKEALLSLLIQRHQVVIEHDYSTQELNWHGSTELLFRDAEPPLTMDALLAMTDASYRNLIHRGIVDHHITGSQNSMIYPLYLSPSSKPRWVSMHLYSRCGRHVLLYGLSSVELRKPASD